MRHPKADGARRPARRAVSCRVRAARAVTELHGATWRDGVPVGWLLGRVAGCTVLGELGWFGLVRGGARRVACAVVRLGTGTGVSGGVGGGWVVGGSWWIGWMWMWMGEFGWPFGRGGCRMAGVGEMRDRGVRRALGR